MGLTLQFIAPNRSWPAAELEWPMGDCLHLEILLVSLKHVLYAQSHLRSLSVLLKESK